MKGFIYLLEISIALILMLVVLGTISTFKSKENWERADLITIGNNVVKALKNEDVLEILNKDFSKIESLIPPNVNFGIKVSGIPKSNITVGCVEYCSFIDTLLTDTYVNQRWINFTIKQFDITAGPIPDYLDAVVFVNYTVYSTWKTRIEKYLEEGGVVIGINATKSTNNVDFNNIFGLSYVNQGPTELNFSTYNPSQEDVEKYFLGVGFDVNSPYQWYIWNEGWNIVYLETNKINITKGSAFREVYEGKNFNLTGPEGIYWFKLKKVWFQTRSDIQPSDTSFKFKNFVDDDSAGDRARGIFHIVKSADWSGINEFAAMTSKNNSIWISDFPRSDEYRTLVKAAIVSRVAKKEWILKDIDYNKEYVAVSSFFSLCCDMPETVELTLYLWYKI